MAHSVPSSTQSSLVQDIDYLASCIMRACEDESVEPQARAIAQYMILCKEMSADECAALFARPGAKRLINKLFDCESEFMGPTPRAFGIDIVVYMTAGKFQQSLDVKHYQKNKTEICLDRITPNIKNNILYSDNDFVWVRVHCDRLPEEECMRPFVIPETRTFKRLEDIDKYFKTHYRGVKEFSVAAVSNTAANKKKTKLATVCESGVGRFSAVSKITSTPVSSSALLNSKNVGYEVVISNEVKIFKVCDKVYEIYVFKTSAASNSVKLESLLHRYGTDNTYSLIFCSELKHFVDNPLLFISNYVKFTYCYSLNQDIFDPKQYEEIKAMTLYMSECALFMSTGNLTNMSVDTHGPLIAYTGERPKVLLSKFKHGEKHAIYNNEGTRAMQTMNKSSDLGARSNYIEVVSKISLDSSSLHDII